MFSVRGGGETRDLPTEKAIRILCSERRQPHHSYHKLEPCRFPFLKNCDSESVYSNLSGIGTGKGLIFQFTTPHFTDRQEEFQSTIPDFEKLTQL